MPTSFAIPLLSASFITSMAEVNSGTTAVKNSYRCDRQAVNEVKR